jgi:predicted MPP superfamily phosphohydrolase
MAGPSPFIRSNITRRAFLIGASAAAGMAIYSGEIGRHRLDIIQRPIAVRNLPDSFAGIRIVQISDLHLDEFTEPFFIERVIRHVNELAADVVLITGDFVTLGNSTVFDANHSIRRCAEIVGTITCPLRYAILGNHDVGVSAPRVIQALKANGIPVLVNQFLPIERGSDRIWLCGVDDPGTSRPDLDLAIPRQPDGPVILMAHEPDYAGAVLRHPKGALVDLMLSGHTHGGQVRLPFGGPLVLPPMGKVYPEGHFHLNNMQLYVNRGIGTVGVPFRLNCPAEITVITLNAA